MPSLVGSEMCIRDRIKSRLCPDQAPQGIIRSPGRISLRKNHPEGRRSVRRGAVGARDERTADARPARALEELLVPAPHDADGPPEEVLDGARAEEARVTALVAIIAHEEDLALRHRDRAERAERGAVGQDANGVRPSGAVSYTHLRAHETRHDL